MYVNNCFYLCEETISRTDRVNPDRNIFSINVELTSTFLLYRGLVHHHHEILNLYFVVGNLVTEIYFFSTRSSHLCMHEE